MEAQHRQPLVAGPGGQAGPPGQAPLAQQSDDLLCGGREEGPERSSLINDKLVKNN